MALKYVHALVFFGIELYIFITKIRPKNDIKMYKL